MVNITVASMDDVNFDNQLIVIGLYEDDSHLKTLGTNPILKVVFDYVKTLDKKNLDEVKKYGKSIMLGLNLNEKITNVLLIGLGDPEKLDTNRIRHIAGLMSLKSKDLGYNRLIVPGFLSDSTNLEPLVEGITLSLYEYNRFKKDSTTDGDHLPLDQDFSITLCTLKQTGEDYKSIVKKMKIICDGVIYSRDLANSPPNIINPAALAKSAQELEDNDNKTIVRVMSLEELEKEGLNGIISVGKGSQNEPKMIIVEYNNSSQDEKPVLLVGKAVTFDTGGISIKPSDRMDEMKFDKSGGCVVLGIMHALSKLNLPINVVAIIPSVENMPSGTAYRPGDIIRMHNGKTVEVLNTDAEGRLILADALSYGVSKYAPKSVIDFATLTGACIIALGTNVAGLIGNNDKLIHDLLSSSKKTGEKIWQLPLYDEFLDLIKSNVATMKNIGGRTGGTITAAAFLSHFVNNVPWAHFDIAGTAWTQDGTSDRSYNPKGSTGFGIRLMLDFLEESIESK